MEPAAISVFSDAKKVAHAFAASAVWEWVVLRGQMRWTAGKRDGRASRDDIGQPGEGRKGAGTFSCDHWLFRRLLTPSLTANRCTAAPSTGGSYAAHDVPVMQFLDRVGSNLVLVRRGKTHQAVGMMTGSVKNSVRKMRSLTNIRCARKIVSKGCVRLAAFVLALFAGAAPAHVGDSFLNIPGATGAQMRIEPVENGAIPALPAPDSTTLAMTTIGGTAAGRV